jgi:hypothetical protein
MRVDNSKTIEARTVSHDPRSPGLSLADEFAMAMAEELLRTTLQYPRWSEIRQGDAPKAFQIAKLILERHAYVAGGVPTTVEDRKRFDLITETLKKEGIHLHKAHDFKKPIFQGSHLAEPEMILQAQGSPNTPTDTVSPLTLALRQRFPDKDCFEFVVGVLEIYGIDYYGDSGVGSALIDKARNRGESPNSYLTGEGVTGLLCSRPVTVRIPKVTSESQAEIWDKIEPHLKRGAILSFSSQYFGHTGIVDRVNGRWVYINASNSEGEGKTYQIVEEDLKREIGVWLERAQTNNTFLTATLGTVDRNLASRFSKTHPMLRSAHASIIY